MGQLKKRKLPLPQDRFSTPIKIMQQANKIEEVRTNEEKFCTKSMNKITDRYRVFKPVSLSAFQIGADTVGAIHDLNAVNAALNRRLLYYFLGRSFALILWLLLPNNGNRPPTRIGHSR